MKQREEGEERVRRERERERDSRKSNPTRAVKYSCYSLRVQQERQRCLGGGRERGYVTNDRFVSRNVTRVILDYRSPIRFLVFNKRKGRSFLASSSSGWSGDKYSRSRATTIREKEIGKR